MSNFRLDKSFVNCHIPWTWLWLLTRINLIFLIIFKKLADWKCFFAYNWGAERNVVLLMDPRYNRARYDCKLYLYRYVGCHFNNYWSILISNLWGHVESDPWFNLFTYHQHKFTCFCLKPALFVPIETWVSSEIVIYRFEFVFIVFLIKLINLCKIRLRTPFPLYLKCF